MKEKTFKDFLIENDGEFSKSYRLDKTKVVEGLNKIKGKYDVEFDGGIYTVYDKKYHFMTYVTSTGYLFTDMPLSQVKRLLGML